MLGAARSRLLGAAGIVGGSPTSDWLIDEDFEAKTGLLNGQTSGAFTWLDVAGSTSLTVSDGIASGIDSDAGYVSVVDLGKADVEFDYTWLVASANSAPQLAVRLADINNYIIIDVQNYGGAAYVRFIKLINGANAGMVGGVLSGDSFAVGVPHRAYGSVVGNNYSLTVESNRGIDTLEMITDVLSTNTKHGLRLYTAGTYKTAYYDSIKLK